MVKWIVDLVQDLERKHIWLVCLLYLAGPICLVLGGVFLAQVSRSHRPYNIYIYNTAVEQWETHGEKSFSLSNFSVENGHSPVVAQLDLTNDWNEETVGKDPDDAIARSYTLRKYLIPLSQLFPQSVRITLRNASIESLGSCEDASACRLNIFDQGCNRGLPAIPVVPVQLQNIGDALLYGKFPCDRTCPAGAVAPQCCSRVCQSARNGFYDFASGSCLLPMVLSSMCIVLPANATCWSPGVWPGDFLCPQHASIATYTGPVPAKTISEDFSFDLASAITIRSSADPFVVASTLTHGTLQFGPYTAGKQRASLALLTVGAVLMGLPCLLCLFLIQRSMRRAYAQKLQSSRGQYVPHFTYSDAPVQPSPPTPKAARPGTIRPYQATVP